MKYPSFYDSVPNIFIYDPLSDFLGATKNGNIEITYFDVVKYAGHSCPTVAGAYLMTLLGLKYFVEKGIKVKRSEIIVTGKGPKSDGTNGVIANVAAYICGVNDESGFAGIGGKMTRRNKLFYVAELDCDLKFETQGRIIKVSYNPSIYPPDQQMIPLLQKSIQGIASIEENEKFKTLWQERVEEILTNQNRYNEIVKIV